MPVTVDLHDKSVQTALKRRGVKWTMRQYNAQYLELDDAVAVGAGLAESKAPPAAPKPKKGSKKAKAEPSEEDVED